MNTSFSSLLYNYESSVSVLAIQSYTPFNKRKWEKRKKKEKKNYYINQLTDATYEYASLG